MIYATTPYLVEIDYPISDFVRELYETNLSIMRKTAENKLKDNSTEVVVDKIRVKLAEEIVRLDQNFPKVPLSYYRYHPSVQKLLEGHKLDDENLFNRFASESITRPRPSGRPRKGIIDEYAKVHPELKGWFDQIKSQMK